MKKNYIKPRLQIEIFTVEKIMTGPPDLLSVNTFELYDANIEAHGTIEFNSGNTLQSIDYSQFKL